LFSDPDGELKLSDEQKEAAVIWRRPSEVFQDIQVFGRLIRPQDVVQRVVADCSLCASIAVCLEHNMRHASKVLPVSAYRSGLRLTICGSYCTGCAIISLSVQTGGRFNRINSREIRTEGVVQRSTSKSRCIIYLCGRSLMHIWALDRWVSSPQQLWIALMLPSYR
jgi:Calpain family cysteine protease